MKTKQQIQERITELKTVVGILISDLEDEADHRNYQDLESDLNTAYSEKRTLEWVLDLDNTK